MRIRTVIAVACCLLLVLPGGAWAAPAPGGTASADQFGSKQGPVVGPVSPGAVWVESYDNYSGLDGYLVLDGGPRLLFQAERNDVTPRVPSLIALDKADGTIDWIAEGVDLTCAPVVGDGVVFAQAHPDHELAGPQADQYDVVALDLTDGSVVGRYTPADGAPDLLPCSDSLVLTEDNVLLVMQKDFGVNNPMVIEALDVSHADGEIEPAMTQEWREEFPARENTDSIQRPYLAEDGSGVYVGWEFDEDTLQVDKLDLDDGSTMATLQIESTDFGLAGDGSSNPYLFVSGGGGFSLVTIDDDGVAYLTHATDSGDELQQAWQIAHDDSAEDATFPAGAPRTLALGVDDRLMVVSGARVVNALDHATGEFIWSYDTQREIDLSRNQVVVDSDGNTIVPTQGGGLLVSVTHDGQLRYESRVPAEILGEDIDQPFFILGPLDDTGTLYAAGSVAVTSPFAQNVPPKPFVAAIKNEALRVGDAPDPIAGAIALCRYLFGDGQARSVVLGRNDVFADVFTGAPLAGDHSCILFTESGEGTELNDDTLAEIRRVLPDGGPVQIVGGTAAVSDVAAQELVDAGFEVSRLGGANRYETAELIARSVVADTGATTAVLGFAGDWPDAVTAGAWGAINGFPVLITDTDALTANIGETITDLGITDVRVAGGTAVISDEAAGAADPDFQRFFGANRFATATSVAGDLWGDTAAGQAFVLANLEAEEGWAYALAASPLSARLAAPQVGIANGGRYPDETSDYLTGLGLDPAPGIFALGNVNLIDDETVQQVADDVGL